MPPPTKTHVDAAIRLLAFDGAGSSVGELARRAGRAYESLSSSLGPVIGAAGVRALMARSLRLTKADFPFFGELVTGADLLESEHLVQCLSKQEPDVASSAATRLYATALAIMGNFIGEPLLWRLLHRAIPTVEETRSEETDG
jgi:hypothetical protein